MSDDGITQMQQLTSVRYQETAVKTSNEGGHHALFVALDSWWLAADASGLGYASI